MRKIIYVLLTILLLNLSNSYPQTWGQYFGFNTFPYHNASQFFPNSVMRVYCDWQLLTPATSEFGEITLGTTWQNFKLDNFLKECQENNITVILDNKEGFSKQYGYGKWHPPIEAGADRKNPNSYLLVSKMGFQLGARYGHNKNIDTSRINIQKYPVTWARPPKPNLIVAEKLVGLGYVDEMEVGNEEDRDWGSATDKWTPDEYAAYLSAVVDGHKGTMCVDCGIWTADSTMPISIGGLARFQKNGFSWIEGVKTWWVQNRGEPFPSDRIRFSYHEYDAGAVESATYNLRTHEEAFSNYTASNDNSFWVGEFGKSSAFISGNTKYMVKQYSKPSLVGKYSFEESLGIDIIKMGTMYFADTNVRYATGYEWKDQIVQVFNDMGGGIHKDNSPKESYEIIRGFHNTINAYEFSEIINESDPYIYELKSGFDRAYVTWCTDKDKIIDYKLGQGNVTTAKRILLSKTGNIEQLLTVNAGEVILPIIEQMPSVVLVDGDLNATPNQSPLMTLTSPSGEAYIEPANVTLSVNATDADGFVQRVEFYQNNVLINTDMSNPYTYTVNNLQAGTYNFSIKAFDNLGLSSTINNISIEVNPTPIISYNLTTQVVNGKRRIFWSDGEQAILSHADSPEGGLNPSWQTDFANLCRSLPKRGINTITVTMRGDDVTSIFPFTTSNGTTPDRVKMNLWKYQLTIFINECKARNLRPIIIAYIGERTNFNKPLAQYQSWLSVLADVLKSGEDISGYFIFGIEEIGQSWSDNQVSSWWNPLNTYIKSVMPKSLTMLHNNPGKKFWRATSPVLQVDVIDIQETTISNMEVSANDVLNRGYAAHLHEWYGAIKVSQSEATNLSKLNQQLAVSERIGCKCSAVFASDYDTQRPDTNKLKSIHQAQSNHLYGNIVQPPDTPTTPSNIEIRYSTNYTRSPSTVFGATIPQGSYWIFSNVAVNWELKKGTSVIKTATNTKYLNGNSNTYLQRGFTYTLTTTNASGTKVITFVVN